MSWIAALINSFSDEVEPNESSTEKRKIFIVINMANNLTQNIFLMSFMRAMRLFFSVEVKKSNSGLLSAFSI